MGAEEADEMKKQPDIGEEIKLFRGDRGQKEFADLLGLQQTTISAIELGKMTPSCETWIRLAALAAQTDPSRASLFLARTGLQPELIEIAYKGQIVLVPPFCEGRWKAQESMPREPVAAWRVPNKGSTYYIASDPARGLVGLGGAPWDTIIFDASETGMPLLGEEVLVDSGKGLWLARLVWTMEHPAPRLALAPAYDPPGVWSPIFLDSTHHPMQRFAGDILGRVIARFPGQPDSYWKRMAGISAPKEEQLRGTVTYLGRRPDSGD